MKGRTVSVALTLLVTGVALLVAGVGEASASTVTPFTSLADWQAAAGPADWFVDFENFTADTGFPVDAGPFSLAQVSGIPISNYIDAVPVDLPYFDPTAYALLFTDATIPPAPDPPEPIKDAMYFDVPVMAWGADFYDAVSNEKEDLLLHLLTGGSVLLSLPQDGFFGFTSHTPILSITFQSRTDDGGVLTGEGFILDNVRGVSAPVPEPASMLLIGTGLVAGGFRRWRKSRTASSVGC